MKFGEKVKEIRLSKNIGIKEFCEMTNFPPMKWTMVEKGLIKPLEGCLDKIFEVLKITVGDKEYIELLRLYTDARFNPATRKAIEGFVSNIIDNIPEKQFNKLKEKLKQEIINAYEEENKQE